MEPRTSSRLPPVTERQREVARLVAEGLTNGEIAERLGISLDGAKYHVSELLTRPGLQRRRQIADWYRQDTGVRGTRGLRALTAPWGAWVFGTATVAVAILVVFALSIGLHNAVVTEGEQSALSVSESRESTGSIGQMLATASMNGPRYRHTATLLDDGRVLITGGSGESAYTAELYEPVKAVFTSTSEMHVVHVDHTATLLQDGRVLVVGGPQETRTAELFDPSSETFQVVGQTLEPRRLHAAVLLLDGRVLIVGGADWPSPDAEIFDPELGRFVPTGALVEGPRQKATTTLLADGRVLITGGCCDDIEHTPWATAEVYDPESGAFTLLEDKLSYGSMTHTATTLTDGRVWISTGDIFDPATNSITPAIRFDRGREATTKLSDGSLLEIGGFVDYTVGASDAIVRFDPESGHVLGTTTMLQPRQGHIATLLLDGTVLIVGGGTGGTEDDAEIHPLDSAELYVP